MDKVIAIDQSPIGRTPRSNPATYTGLFGDIRELLRLHPRRQGPGLRARAVLLQRQGRPVRGLRGDGMLKIEMHFLPDIYVPCEVCKGKRYNRETLEVTYKGKNISRRAGHDRGRGPGVLRQPAQDPPKAAKPSVDVGLGYIKLGQSSTTLSGGEAQRVKLATELSRRSTGKHHLYPGRAHHRPAHRRRPQARGGAGPPGGGGATPWWSSSTTWT